MLITTYTTVETSIRPCRISPCSTVVACKLAMVRNSLDRSWDSLLWTNIKIQFIDLLIRKCILFIKKKPSQQFKKMNSKGFKHTSSHI